jgi:hypothetical protein
VTGVAANEGEIIRGWIIIVMRASFTATRMEEMLSYGGWQDLGCIPNSAEVLFAFLAWAGTSIIKKAFSPSVVFLAALLPPADGRI